MRTLELPPTETLRIEQVLYALSDPIRLDIVRKLARDGDASCAALDGGRPKSSMSHHFRALRAAGVIQTRTEGVVHMNALRRQDLDLRFPGLLDAVLAAADPTET